MNAYVKTEGGQNFYLIDGVWHSAKSAHEKLRRIKMECKHEFEPAEPISDFTLFVCKRCGTRRVSTPL